MVLTFCSSLAIFFEKGHQSLAICRLPRHLPVSTFVLEMEASLIKYRSAVKSSWVNQFLYFWLFWAWCLKHLFLRDTLRLSAIKYEDVWNLWYSYAIHLMGPSRNLWNLIKNKSRVSPNQIGSTSWIFVNIWICLWECMLFFNVCDGRDMPS